MNRWMLTYICCPVCKGELHLSEAESSETEVLEGVLTCANCERSYSIAEGIANLLPENQSTR